MKIVCGLKRLVQGSDAVHAEKNIRSVLENYIPRSKETVLMEFIMFLVDYVLLGVKFFSKILRIKSGGIASDDCEFLYNFCKKEKIKTILEFGPGSSTSCFLKLKDIKLVGFENDEEWLKVAREKFKEYSNVSFFKFRNEKDIELNVQGNFDLSFVDSSLGNPASFRLDTCLYAMKYTKVIILHDSKRRGEQETIEHLRNLGWSPTQINTKKGLCILRKIDA